MNNMLGLFGSCHSQRECMRYVVIKMGVIKDVRKDTLLKNFVQYLISDSHNRNPIIIQIIGAVRPEIRVKEEDESRSHHSNRIVICNFICQPLCFGLFSITALHYTVVQKCILFLRVLTVLNYAISSSSEVSSSGLDTSTYWLTVSHNVTLTWHWFSSNWS
jgi:hypothetical protein